MIRMLMLVCLAALTVVSLSAGPVPQSCSSCTFTDFGITEYSGGACPDDPGRFVDCSGVTCQVNNPNPGECRVSGTVSVTRCGTSQTVDACVVIQDNFASTPTHSDGIQATFATGHPSGPFYCGPGYYNIVVTFSKTWSQSTQICTIGTTNDNASWLGTYTCN